MIKTTVTTRPAPVVSLAQAKSWLRIDHTTDDDLLEDIVIPAAQSMIEMATGRALSADTAIEVVVTADSNDGWLVLPFAPAQSVELPTTGVTLAADTVTITADVDVTIEYTAGYDVCPPDLVIAVLMQVAWMYNKRGEDETQSMNPAISKILKLYTRNLPI